MLQQHNLLRILISLSIIYGFSNAGGVYPNYHANFEFISLDTEKTVSQLDAEKKWWQSASFYQIYPRSFKDSNGDGVGDLKGITQQLPYLKEIGIAGTWLSPIFKSPMADFGYDIANFTQIDPIFGTMEDIEGLLAEAKNLDIKIILDFVPNHSSDECEWFKRSAARDPIYEDFYVWHPGKMVNGERHPPSNWLSVFRGSAWEWHEGRQEYYLHQFLKKQPDLNYRNPRVQETMKDVLRFWLRKGVSGFRIDAVPHLFEVRPDGNGNYPDEPRNNNVPDPDDYAYLNHIYTYDQPETLDMAYQWRAVLDEFQKENGGDELILMAEVGSPIDTVMRYYGNDTVEGTQIPFNFLLLNWVTNNSDAYHYAETVNTWLAKMPKGRTANWVIGNHDQNRVGSRLGSDRIDMMNILTMTLPGCSITYNGEEIGMLDVWISWKDTVDPAACNSKPDIYEKFSRDPERTPFQWNDEKNAGFSNANRTWLPVNNDYKTLNVKRQRGISMSHLNIFKQLQKLRQNPTLRHGDVEVKAVGSNAVLGIKRSLLKEHTFVTLMNIFDKIVTVDLNKVFDEMPEKFVYILVTDRSIARLGTYVKSNSVTLMPKEAVVLMSPTKLTTTIGYFAYYSAQQQKNN